LVVVCGMQYLALLPLVLGAVQRDGAEPLLASSHEASLRAKGAKFLGSAGLLSPAAGFSVPAPRARTVMRARAGERSRRQGQVGNVLASEIGTIIRTGSIYGRQKIPPDLRAMISVVDVDPSPDLGNARVKVSILGDRKDKITAMRWLQKNAKTIRFEFAQRNKHMRRVPTFMFDHVDVGEATQVMIRIDKLRRKEEAEARARGEEWGVVRTEQDDIFDFDASEDDAFDFDDDGDDIFEGQEGRSSPPTGETDLESDRRASADEFNGIGRENSYEPLEKS